MQPNETDQNTKLDNNKALWIKIWPVYVFIVIVAAAIFALRHFGIGIDTLRDNYQVLSGFVADNLVLSVAVFILIYMVTTAFALPMGSLTTISGGALFGLAIGSVSTIIGATLGASLLFGATNTFLGKHLRAQAGPFLKTMESGFKDSPFTFMFAMRLVPAVPFYIANIAPAMLGAKFRDYFVTTALGIVPGVVAYTWIGVAVRDTLAAQGDVDIGTLAANFTPAFIALAVVAMIPVIIRLVQRWKAGRAES